MCSCEFDQRRPYQQVSERTAEMQNGARTMFNELVVSGFGVIVDRNGFGTQALTHQEPVDSFTSMFERNAESTLSSRRAGETNQQYTQIEQRHGDLRRRNLAANVIQKAYRTHVLNKSFLDLRNRQRNFSQSVDFDGTMTLTPNRAGAKNDFISHGEQHIDEVNRDFELFKNGRIGTASDNSKMRVEISPSCVSQVNDSARWRELSRSGSANFESQHTRRDAPSPPPVWIRQLDAAAGIDAFHFDSNSVEFDEDGDSLGNSASLTLRSSNHSDTNLHQSMRKVSEPARSHSRNAIANSSTSVSIARQSIDAPPVGSHDCDCEECRMSKRIEQLSVLLGCDTERAGRPTMNTNNTNTTTTNGPVQPRPVPAFSASSNALPVTVPHRLATNVNANANAAVAPGRQAPSKRPEINRTLKRLYRVALNLFNRDPDAGVPFLVAAGFVRDEPRAIAHFLLARRGLARSAIGDFLGGALRNVAVSKVLAAFVGSYRFINTPIDVALRQFQSSFQLTGEAQRIQRIVEAFAEEYANQNDEILRIAFRTPKAKRADLVQLVALACLMLNTDLHSPSVRADRKMKPEEFVRNLSGLDDGADLERNSLLGMYERVRLQPFATASDHMTSVRKLETVLIGLSNARPLSQVAAEPRQRRKSNAASLLNRHSVVKQSSETTDLLSPSQCETSQSLRPGTTSASTSGFVYQFELAKLAVPYRRIVCCCQLFEVDESAVRKMFTAGTIQVEVGEGNRVRTRVSPQVAFRQDNESRPTSGLASDDSLRREVFLFNDSLLVTRGNSRVKAKKSGEKPRATSFTFHRIASLLNAHVAPFATAQIPYGLCLVAPASDLHCAKSASDLFMVTVGTNDPVERTSARNSMWQDSSSNSSSHSNLSGNNCCSDMLVAVLVLAAKSSKERDYFCDEIVESIVETRTMRRVLGHLAEGAQPADIARSYVPPSKSTTPASTGATASSNGRRGSEPFTVLPQTNLVNNAPTPTPTPTTNNSNRLSEDFSVRQMSVLSVSSGSSSQSGSLGQIGTPNSASLDECLSVNSRPMNSQSQNQKQSLLVTPEKAHVLTATDVQHLLRTGSPHHAPVTPSPLALPHPQSPINPMAYLTTTLPPTESTNARRSLQFSNKPTLAMHHSFSALRTRTELDESVVENSEYLTFGDTCLPLARR